MKKEIFKDIPNCNGFYEVSNYGNVKSFKRSIKGVLLKKVIGSNGYYCVNIHMFGVKRTSLIHHLVATTFLNHNIKGYKLVIDHINNNKLDNRLENLQLITQRENTSKDRKGTSKYTGVYLDKQSNKWRSAISINGKIIKLGSFEKEIDAHLVYQEALNNLKN